MKKIFLGLILITLTACNNSAKAPEETKIISQKSCANKSIALKELETSELSPNNEVTITFEATNISNQDYNINQGDIPMQSVFNITTEDGTFYENINLFGIQELAAGEKQNIEIIGTVGPNKVLANYEVGLICIDA